MRLHWLLELSFVMTVSGPETPEPRPSDPGASSAEQLRKEGNELFKCGDYEGALTAYTQALSLGATPQDQAILHRNRAACHLKLEDYSKAESEASKAIEKDGGDVKALYRRSQALEKLGRLDQAVLDLKRCVSLEPKNKVFQESLRNIGGQIQEKVRYMSSTDAKVEQMFQILLDPKEKGTEKKQKASQNLVVLAREDAGAEKIFRSNGVQLLQRLLDTEETDLMLAAHAGRHLLRAPVADSGNPECPGNSESRLHPGCGKPGRVAGSLPPAAGYL